MASSRVKSAMSGSFNIINDFYDTACRTPHAVAITAGKHEISYGELAQLGGRIAAALQPKLKTHRVGILGSRSIAAYAGIVGTAWAGATYVPLNMKWPSDRLIALLDDLELDALIVDHNGAKLLNDEVRLSAPDLIIRPDDAIDIPGSISFSALPEKELERPISCKSENLGYILFTSGTTGMPKGVMVSNGSIIHYLDETEKWTRFTGDDRVAEAQDITFDLSVHNMFLAWRAGASLHLMTALDMMAPLAFIRKHNISVWMSVPTIVNAIRRANKLSAGLLPSVRLSIFCGEPLALATANAWAEATPNSVVENIYGPTECTIACTRQTFTNPAIATPERGILAIGAAYENVGVDIWGEDGTPLADNETGEIMLNGSQLAVGYFNAPEKTAASFRVVGGVRWYHTGDLGCRDTNGIFHHMGRLDNQVKMKGNRIELEEVETHLRGACQTELAAVVAWPVIDGSAQGLVGFTSSDELSEHQIQSVMKKNLPDYMIPSSIRIGHNIPRNTSDKIDRKALLAQLDAPGMETPTVAKTRQTT